MYYTFITIPLSLTQYQRTRPGFHFCFQPLDRPRLVPIGSSCDAGHFHTILGAKLNGSTRPSKPTRILFSFSATPPAKVGTDRNLVQHRSCPCHPCRQKAFGRLPIEAVKSRGTALQFPEISPIFGDATTLVLFPTISSVFSDQP